MAKIYAAQAIAKTCGFDSKTFVVTERKLAPPVININIVDDDGTVTKYEDFQRQKSLPPVADAEVVEPE
jgi:hypothetical protein